MSAFDPNIMGIDDTLDDTFTSSNSSSTPHCTPNRHSTTALTSSLDAYRSKSSLQTYNYPLLDPYLPLFRTPCSSTGLTDTRSSNPLTRRGYYVRQKCVDITVDKFIKGGGTQIVELGSGWSTLYLRTFESFEEDFTWVEVDYPSLLDSKIECLSPVKDLTGSLKFLKRDITGDAFVDDLKKLIDPSVRTLFILEAVGMYIPSSSFSDLLRNLTGEFKKCEVAVYDVVLQGRFGLMMKENLVKAGVHPLGLSKTSLNAWSEFFSASNLKKSEVMTMLQAYKGGIMSREERMKCDGVEFLDEVEEWEMIMNCYCFCMGRNYDCD